MNERPPIAVSNLCFPAPDASLAFTGERYVSSLSGPIQHEHYHRYLFAAQFCVGKDILDIACGEGYGSAMLGEVASSVAGVDIDTKTIAFADSAYSTSTIRFRQGSALQIPIDNDSIDVVVSFETLEHFAEHDAFMSEIKRVLRPNGLLIISSPNRLVYSAQDGFINEYHVRELDEDGFRGLLQRYFANHTLLAQRALCGSVLISDQSEPNGLLGFETTDGRRYSATQGVPAPHYYVALASNNELPLTTDSLLQDSAYLTTLDSKLMQSEIHAVALANEVGVRDREIIRLQCEIGMRDTKATQLKHESEVLLNQLHTRDTEAAQLKHASEAILKQLHASDIEAAQMKHESEALLNQLHARDIEATQMKHESEALLNQLHARDIEAAQMKHESEALLNQISLLSTAIMQFECKIKDFSIENANLSQTVSILNAHPAIRLSKRLKRVGLSRRRLHQMARLIKWGLSGQLLKRINERRALRRIYASHAFDPAWYLRTYPDVVTSGMDPVLHFLRHGVLEGRDPSPQFSVTRYRANHPKLAAAKNPLLDALRSERLVDGQHPIARQAIPNTLDQSSLVFKVHMLPQLGLVLDARQGLEPLLPTLSVLVREQDSVALELLLLVVPGSEIKLAGAQRLLCALADGEAIGRAIGLCRSPLVLLSNNTIAPAPGATKAIVEAFALHPSAGLVCGKVIDREGVIVHAGGGITPDGMIKPRGAGLSCSHFAMASITEVEAAPPGLLAVKVSSLAACGGLGASFESLWLQAADLSVRMRAAGAMIWCQPAAEGFLLAPQSSMSQQDAKILLGRSGSTIAAGRTITRPRALFVDYQTPKPDQDSGSGDIYWLMRIMQNLGYDVTFLPVHDMSSAGHYTDKLRQIGIVCVTTVGGVSPEVFIKETAALFEISFIHRVSIAMRCLPQLRKAAPNLRIVFNTVDLHHLRELREAQLLQCADREVSALATREQEYGMIKQADLTILLSRVEQAIITRDLPDATTRVIPIIRDLPIADVDIALRRDVVFIGGFAHLPNIDAITRFVVECWPLVRTRLPQVRLLVVGSNATPEILALADSGAGIDVLGHVEDLSALLARCRVTVAPLRYGAGIKGKVVSSLTHGVPCVASHVAAEGMGVTDGQELLIADDPETFADGVARLCEDDALWLAMSHTGLAYARAHFSVEHGTDLMRALLTDLALPVVAASTNERPKHVA